MRCRVLAFIAAASLGLGQIAFAADVPAKAPAPAVYNWTGPYLGIQGGGGWGRHDRSVIPPGFRNSYGSSGALIGGHAGYNWQWNPLVLGIEGDMAWADDIDGTDGGAGGTTDGTKVRWLGSARGRIGWAWNHLLLYGTVGQGFANLRHSNSGPPIEKISRDQSGVTGGGGIELGFSPNWSARVEYRYWDLGSYRNRAPTNGVFPFKVDSRLQTVTLGVTYRFGPWW